MREPTLAAFFQAEKEITELNDRVGRGPRDDPLREFKWVPQESPAWLGKWAQRFFFFSFSLFPVFSGQVGFRGVFWWSFPRVGFKGDQRRTKTPILGAPQVPFPKMRMLINHESVSQWVACLFWSWNPPYLRNTHMQGKQQFCKAPKQETQIVIFHNRAPWLIGGVPNLEWNPDRLLGNTKLLMGMHQYMDSQTKKHGSQLVPPISDFSQPSSVERCMVLAP